MSIEFHCKHCGKKIRTADTAAGKSAKCPACHNKLYIPQPEPEEDEELRLAPIDEDDMAKQKQLMDESYELTQKLLSEKELPDEPVRTTPSSSTNISDDQLTSNIITYLQQMADGNLDEAEQLVKSIAPCGRRAVKILDKLSFSEIPEPELADIPPQVLSGLIKTLRSKIH